MARKLEMHAEATPESPAKQSAVLIVLDDGAEARDLYGEYLQFCGFRVTTARDTAEALRVAHAQTPDVVVIDVSAVRDGEWARIGEFRKDPVLHAIPVIALAPFSGDRLDEARAAGAVVCLPKPCLPSQIARTIRVLLVGRASGR